MELPRRLSVKRSGMADQILGSHSVPSGRGSRCLWRTVKDCPSKSAPPMKTSFNIGFVNKKVLESSYESQHLNPEANRKKEDASRSHAGGWERAGNENEIKRDSSSQHGGGGVRCAVSPSQRLCRCDGGRRRRLCRDSTAHSPPNTGTSPTGTFWRETPILHSIVF